MFDLDHPFFRPRWVRIAIVAVTLVWALVEVIAGAPIWGGLFGAIGLYASYKFFIGFNPRDKP